MIKKEITDEIYEQYTKDDFVMDKWRFWQAVNQLRIENNQLKDCEETKEEKINRLLKETQEMLKFTSWYDKLKFKILRWINNI